VSGERRVGGGARSQLLWLDLAAGATRQLVELPSEVVPGSYSWSPDGRRAAFLVRSAQLTALCLVDAAGGFRYLADVGRDDPSPLPFPPLTWAPDGRRLVYAAPVQDRSNRTGWLWGGAPTSGLFLTDPERPLGERIAGAEGQAPVWLPDGRLLALARPRSDRPLQLRGVDPEGTPRDLGPLPLSAPGTYAARWDPARAQALVALRASAGFGGGRPDYWLLRFAPEAGG
jgi:Tol biopolymer transport system component